MKAIPSTSTAATVRAYLGLSQAALGQYLGLTRGQVAHVEAGRRGLNRPATHLLNQLADLLPPPLGEGPPEPDLATLPAELPDPHPLRRRQRRCVWQAANLRLDLEKRVTRAHQARRWQQLLPGLLAALPARPADAPSRRWLTARATNAQAELDPASTAARVLLQLRIRYLEAEAAELARLLAAT